MALLGHTVEPEHYCERLFLLLSNVGHASRYYTISLAYSCHRSTDITMQKRVGKSLWVLRTQTSSKAFLLPAQICARRHCRKPEALDIEKT